ncbi:MAG: c-type cytochrome domain-containing protein [Planctomycetaceae bacterium]
MKLIRVPNMSSSQRLLEFCICVAVARLSVLVSPAIADDDLDVPAAQVEFFEKEVRPLLVERCHACHGSDKQKGSLRLDSRAAILQGGDTGPAIVPQHPDESELVKAIRYGDDGYQMPPDGKLPQEEIDRLIKWVEMGAPWPSEQSVSSSAGVVPQMLDFDERTKHWSFQPLQRPKIPKSRTSSGAVRQSTDFSSPNWKKLASHQLPKPIAAPGSAVSPSMSSDFPRLRRNLRLF